MVHDAGPRRGRLERMRRRFGDRADVVVFGHSHLPLHEEAPRRLPDLQPGKPDRSPPRARSHDGANHACGTAWPAVSSYPFDTVYGIITPGELIKELRTEHGLSQRELAYRAGTSQSAIARIEGGDEDITWKRLRSILVRHGRPAGSRQRAAAEPLRHRRPDARAGDAGGGAARERHQLQPLRRREMARAGAKARAGMAPPERIFEADAILRVLVATPSRLRGHRRGRGAGAWIHPVHARPRHHRSPEQPQLQPPQRGPGGARGRALGRPGTLNADRSAPAPAGAAGAGHDRVGALDIVNVEHSPARRRATTRCGQRHWWSSLRRRRGCRGRALRPHSDEARSRAGAGSRGHRGAHRSPRRSSRGSAEST